MLPCPLLGARLLIEGGGDDLPPRALEQFCDWCTENKTRKGFSDDASYIVLIPWPSVRSPQEILED